MSKYNEISRLSEMLAKEGIKHILVPAFDGLQIILPYKKGWKQISVVEHEYSYGSKSDLLEIEKHGKIQGFLTAEQALGIIKALVEREGRNE